MNRCRPFPVAPPRMPTRVVPLLRITRQSTTATPLKHAQIASDDDPCEGIPSFNRTPSLCRRGMPRHPICQVRDETLPAILQTPSGNSANTLFSSGRVGNPTSATLSGIQPLPTFITVRGDIRASLVGLSPRAMEIGLPGGTPALPPDILPHRLPVNGRQALNTSAHSSALLRTAQNPHPVSLQPQPAVSAVSSPPSPICWLPPPHTNSATTK